MTLQENKKYIEACGCVGTPTKWIKLCAKHEAETKARHEQAAKDHHIKQLEKHHE